MAAKANLTKAADFGITAREVDFVTRFNRNWTDLMDVLGILRPIKKAPGTILRSYTTTVTLQSGAVAEGNEIPYSKATLTPTVLSDLTLEKFAKAVSIEAVNEFGAEIAIQRTDDAFLNELQNLVFNRFITFLGTGTLEPDLDEGETIYGFQYACALAMGLVRDKFKKIHRDSTNIVTIANTLDAYSYLGNAVISNFANTTNGLTYLKSFLGTGTLLLSSDIDRGTVLATPSENIVLYYADPSDSDFRQLGLEYTVEGQTNLIGFHANGNYSTAVGESYAIMGMALSAEYLDGIAKVEFTPDGTTPASAGGNGGEGGNG